jgi:hypothetical protein
MTVSLEHKRRMLAYLERRQEALEREGAGATKDRETPDGPKNTAGIAPGKIAKLSPKQRRRGK